MVSCVQITSHTNSAVLAFIYHALIKAAPWDDINYCFNFRTEVVYPTDHAFIFFRIFIFLLIFLINISMKPEVTQTNYLYT